MTTILWNIYVPIGKTYNLISRKTNLPFMQIIFVHRFLLYRTVTLCIDLTILMFSFGTIKIYEIARGRYSVQLQPMGLKFEIHYYTSASLIYIYSTTVDSVYTSYRCRIVNNLLNIVVHCVLNMTKKQGKK